MDNYELLGACGLYCGACDHYRVTLDDGKHLLDTEKFKDQNLDDLTCQGCHSNKHTKWCSVCKMRLCAKDKEITHCALCDMFPCEIFKEFEEGGRKWEGAKHRNDIRPNLDQIIELGEEKWLTHQKGRWQCQCGHSYTFYEKDCIQCSTNLDSYANK